MTIGFSFRMPRTPVAFRMPRAAAATCALCVAGVLVFAPVAAAAAPKPGPAGGPRAVMPRPSVLYGHGTLMRPRP
ncbi:hypothetical protein ACWDAQ_44960, partial [Streptomyces sp. NPDC001139]